MCSRQTDGLTDGRTPYRFVDCACACRADNNHHPDHANNYFSLIIAMRSAIKNNPKPFISLTVITPINRNQIIIEIIITHPILFYVDSRRRESGFC